MPKLKTRKRTKKRFKITKTGKVIKRKARQDHFNSKESRKKTLNKRRDVAVLKTDAQIIKKQMPYR